MNTTPEIELVQRARTGDVPAFEELYRQYNPRIYNFARQITGSADDACDAVQETFIRAWNSLPRLRVEETFSVWLHRITLNYCRDTLKKRGRQSTLSIDSPPSCDGDEPSTMEIECEGPSPEDCVISAEMQGAVQRALCSLSEEHRLVVMMHHMDGLDVQSIASILGIAKGTVMSRLSRAREVLRRKLVPYVEGDLS